MGTLRHAYGQMHSAMYLGFAVATDTEVHPDIPVIEDLGSFPQRMANPRCVGETDDAYHKGKRMFKWGIIYGDLQAQLEANGFDPEAVHTALVDLEVQIGVPVCGRMAEWNEWNERRMAEERGERG